MKKLLLFGLALAASTASAATITMSCSVFSQTTQSGSGTETCPGFSPLPNGVTAAQITSITVTTAFDITFNQFGGAGSATYNFALPGAVNISGTASTAGARPDVKTTTLCTGASCASNPYMNSFSITDTWTGSGSVTGATFSKQFSLDYTDPVPEPATVGLVGMMLVGIGLIRRRS